jgi:glycolate oxidase FAD binding subunit
MNNSSLKELGETIQFENQLLAFGGRTKSAITASPSITALDMAKITGILEYQPDEYTFTAYAGTSLALIDQALAEHGQYMPFDPPLIKRGGTLGGTVAANLSGPGRYRYGGVRDFILGVQFFDYQARLIRSGGKVVKNAAGFDIPKLMVGSLGSLGALVELSFKVFPKPPEFRTVISKYSSFGELFKSLVILATSSIELFCLEIEPAENNYDLRVRIGGVPKLFPKRIERLKQYMGDVETLQGEEEQGYWDQINDFSWVPEGTLLLKVPITPTSLPALDEYLIQNETARRYSVGANVAWIAWSKPINLIDSFLKESKLEGLPILGKADQMHLGVIDSGNFYQRIKKALDPIGKWAEV